MEKKLHSLFFLFFLSSCYPAFAQNSNAWEPVKLDVAGHSSVNGIDASFQKSLCSDGEEVIIVKFTNNNKYPVTIKWYDAILTQGNTWIKKDNSTAKKFLNIDPNKEIKGNCSSDEYIECVIKLKDYLDKLSDYRLYAIYRFEVLEVKK